MAVMVVAGRSKRSRVLGGRKRYGSANETVYGAMAITRDSIEFGQHTLGLIERQRPEPAAGFCQCEDNHNHNHNHSGSDARGATLENAMVLDDDDDDDDLEVIAIRPRQLPLNQRPIDEGGRFVTESILTAEEISGHQRQKVGGIFGFEQQPVESVVDEGPIDRESCMSTDGDFLIRNIKGGLKEVKSALKKLNTKPRGRKPKAAAAVEEKPEGGGKVKDGNAGVQVEDDVDEERMFLSPKHKKTRDVVYAESDKEGPDYEVYFDSDSDREPEVEPEDPFDDIWKECAVMARQVLLLNPSLD